MSKARQLADLGNQIDDGAITGTNMIINGAMTVAQRGVTSTSSGYKTVDRFYTQDGSSGAVTWSQSSDAPDGFVNSVSLEVTTADSSIATNEYMRIFQNVEGNVSSSLAWGGSGAKPAMLSFWVKSSITGTFGVALQDGLAATSYLQTYTINSANTWEYKTVYVPPATSGTWPTDNTQSIRLAFSFAMGSQYTQPASSTWYTSGDYRGPDGVTNIMATVGNTVKITGVCLNVGDSAIAFPHESYGETLAKCQRYFYRYTGASDDRWGVYYSNSNTTTSTSVSFPVTMRSLPTGVVSSNGLLRVRDLSDGAGGDITPSTLTCLAPTKDRWKIAVNAQLSNAAQILAFATKLDFDAEV
jgi:hypothetical protein